MPNYLAFVFNHFSEIFFFCKLIFVVLIVLVFFVILVYFRIKKSDKLDLFFFLINFLCIMPISIIINLYGYTVLLYLYIPFILCSSDIVKDKIRGKNEKYRIYFIQFIIIIIFMIIIRSLGPFVFVFIFSYFESEYIKLFMPDSIKSLSKNTCKVVEKLGYFLSHSEKDIPLLKETDLLNEKYYEHKILDIQKQLRDLYPLKTTKFDNLFNKTENLIKLKWIFDVTCFRNPASPTIKAWFPFLANSGYVNAFRPNEWKIYNTEESRILLEKTIELKIDVIIHLAMQKFLGLYDFQPFGKGVFRSESKIICNIDVGHSIVTNYRDKYPALYAEFQREKAIKNNSPYRAQPNIHVWEYLEKLGKANFSNNTELIDLDLAKTRMEDYYNNCDKKRNIDMVEEPTTGEASKRIKH
jgi:hypothetical protein